MKNLLKQIILSSNILTKVIVYFVKLRLKKNKKISYGKNVFIGFSTKCEGRNSFARNSSLIASEIGYGSYLAASSHIANSKIGRYTSIGPNVSCIFGKHPVDTFVSTHPYFFSTTKRAGISYTDKQLFEEFAPKKDEDKLYSIIIGNDVWIGANVSLIDGVTIGDGAIIASNALVNKDVPPYTVYGGVPAKFIKNRFKEEHIEFLTKLKWWNKPETWIKEHSHLFTNVDLFYSKFQNER